MYPKLFSPVAARQRFDYGNLRAEYEKIIPIVDIDACKEIDLEMSWDLIKANEELQVKLKSLQDKSSLIIFSIPSPFGSKEVSGKTIKHAVSVIVDRDHRTLFLQEPCYGETDQYNNPCRFPVGLKELLERQFPDFKIIEHDVNVQKRGENFCHLAALMRAKSFTDVNSYTGKRITGAMVTREKLIENWPATMAMLNEKVPRMEYINYTSFAFLADIKLALMKNFNIDTSKYTLSDSDPYPPVSNADPKFGQFQRLTYSLFNQLTDDEKYHFLSGTLEFVNSTNRGELTEYGKVLSKKIADIIQEKFPKLLMPLEVKTNDEATHKFDPELNAGSEQANELFKEIASLIITMIRPSSLPSEGEHLKPNVS